MLPELVGKYFSKIQPATSVAAQGPSKPANEHQWESDPVESCPSSAPKKDCFTLVNVNKKLFCVARMYDEALITLLDCMLNYYIAILQNE